MRHRLNGPAGRWRTAATRALAPVLALALAVLMTGAGGSAEAAAAEGAQAGAPPLQRTGRIDRIAPRPSAFVAPREVQVWLPPGYADEPERRYPVLYLNDGQNVFDALAAGAEWQADETAQRLVLAGEVAPMIIVAVSSGEQRVFDYTTRSEPRVKQPGGGAARYARYLVEELKPFIDSQYRTQPVREAAAVGGSSLAALVSLGLLLEHGGTFGAALVVSPAVWWADEQILKDLAVSAPQGEPPRIWLDIGSEEGAQALAGARRLRDALHQRGWPPAYVEQAGGRHDEAAWAARMEPMLRFLYGRP